MTYMRLHDAEYLRQFIDREIAPLVKRIEALERSSGLLVRVSDVLRDIDKDNPEWGLRALAEECKVTGGIK